MTDDPAVLIADDTIGQWEFDLGADGSYGVLANRIVAAFRTPEGARALFPEVAEAVDLTPRDDETPAPESAP